MRLMYSYPLLNGLPQILDYNEDVRNFNLESQVKEIANRWCGIPLKGPAQDELLQDFKNAGITDNQRHSIDTFKKCISQFEAYGITLKEKQAGKKDLETWPQYLSKPREKFKIIISP